MRNPIISISLKKLILVIVIFLCFIILLPMLMLGINKKEGINSIPKYEDEDKIEQTIKNSLKGVNAETIKVYITKEDKIEECKLEDYLVGVVAAEMPANFEKEALKAQAVAARTYALSKILNKCSNGKGADICDSTHCQAFLRKEEKIKAWNDKYAEEYWKKIQEAVNETSGEILTYEGELVMKAQYFSVSSGKTENASEVFSAKEPYLKSVDSPGEEIAPKFTSKVTIGNKDFSAKINHSYSDAKLSSNNPKSQVNILKRNEGGSVKEIKAGNITMSGVEFRKIFGLNSANFTLNFNKSNVDIICKGYGHGVGMSQWGANVMAKNGSSYKEILNHYYQGIKVDLIKNLASK